MSTGVLGMYPPWIGGCINENVQLPKAKRPEVIRLGAVKAERCVVECELGRVKWDQLW